MPYISVQVPKGAFSDEARATFVTRLVETAATVERIPAEANKRFLSWVLVEESEPGMWTCGGIDMTADVLPCFAMAHVPVGALDRPSRAHYIKLIHDAFKKAKSAYDKRQLATSVIVLDVADGSGGGNGTVWTSPTLAKAAAHAHLQHLVVATSNDH